jgi:hypothetical protein
VQTFFVTNEGISAALGSGEILGNLKSVLLSQAAPRVIGQLKKRGFIAPEKRKNPLRVEHNALVLDGVIDRIRTIAAPQRTNGGKPAEEPRSRLLAPRIGYVAVRPGSSPRDLTPSTEQVYKALGKRPQRIGEIAEKVKDVHPNTIRWAIQILRQRRLVKSIVLES